MPNAPIGIKFIPGQEQAADGPRQGDLAGLPEQAFRILSLRLPRRPSFRGLAPQELLESRGAAGFQPSQGAMQGAMAGRPGTAPGGFNPMAAVFEALLKASIGGGAAPSPRVGAGVTAPAPGPSLPIPSPQGPVPASPFATASTPFPRRTPYEQQVDERF